MGDSRDNERQQESFSKTMASMEADNQKRQKLAAQADTRRKDAMKEELLDNMDSIIPRSERLAVTGKSRSFFFPAEAHERIFGKQQRSTL